MNNEIYLRDVPPHFKILKKVFKNYSKLIIFEIGACDALDTIRYKRFFANSIIHVFEPLLKNFLLAQENAKTLSKITFNNVALSDTKGKALFYESMEINPSDNNEWDYGNKSSSLLPPKEHLVLFNNIGFKNGVEIETTTLDDYCELNNFAKIDFIHMDVQGAELMVLKGGDRIIENTGLIYLEVSNVELYEGQPLHKDISRYMKSKGFDCILNTVGNTFGDQLYIRWSHFGITGTIKKALYKLLFLF